MMDIAVYTLTSVLHDAKKVDASTKEFLESLHILEMLKDDDYSDFGSHVLNLIFVRTGGTEGLFKRLLPSLNQHLSRPFYLLTSGESNSLAASLEILSFLQQKGLSGEIIHGNTAYMMQKIAELYQVEQAIQRISKIRLGVIGQPSDWLISSNVDYVSVKEHLGIKLIDIPMGEVLKRLKSETQVPEKELLSIHEVKHIPEKVQTYLSGATHIYHVLRQIVEDYFLEGFTIRCFDLLTTIHNTGCLALAQLNAEGIVAGCEGDIPALLSMAIGQKLLGVSGFQANPAYIDVEKGEITFAHCTIPLNMVQRYELDTHFESGIGVGVRGYMQEGPVTIFKVSGDLSRFFVEEGMLVCCQAKPNLCRTQQIIRLTNPDRVTYFLKKPIGNHHIIFPGHCKSLLEAMLTK